MGEASHPPAQAAVDAPGQINLVLDGPVATLHISHPARRNALTVAMWHQITQAARLLATLPAVRCVMLRGAGGHFCAGADISEMPAVRHDRATGTAYHEEVIRPALSALLALDKPLIAGIEGDCVGGGLELAACCDLRVANNDARFGAPVLHKGFPLAPFEWQVVSGAFGRAATMSLLVSGELIEAPRALALGMLQHVWPRAGFEWQLADLARRVSQTAPAAVAVAKQLARGQCEDPYAFLDSPDYCEGILAFIERRAPQFGKP